MTRWELVCNPDAAPDARDAAWRALRERIRQPVLFQLRRRIKGWRLTEDLADEVCDIMRDRYEGAGGSGHLRDCLVGVMTKLFAERELEREMDDRFEQDWAAAMLHAALREHRRAHPDTHLLLLHLYDRPEGTRPMQPAELASRLQQPASLVEERVTEGRTELRRLFAQEIAHTMTNGDTESEVEHFLPRAGEFLQS